ncbi:MAG TPA: glycosyltransferase [Baekduia sp.]|nr:glycosyltransferase [Baekduia sp.]
MSDHRGVLVSIVVPLSGGAERTLACLQGLSALPADPAFEVVVVDDAAPDLAPVLAMLEGDVAIERLPRRSGLAAATAAGVARATGDVVVLLRDVAVPEPQWLRALVAALADPAVAASASVDADAPTPAVAAHALAWRRAELSGVPPVPDELVVAALCAELARRGEVRSVSDAIVTPAGRRSAVARGGGAFGAAPELTVVIPTLDAAGERLRRCVAAIQGATSASHEIVIVDNGSPPQGFTAPVNAGLRAGRGRYLVVCNDDVEVLPGWWDPLRAALDAGAAVAFPHTVDGAMRTDFAAWCFALSRDTLERHAVADGEFLDPDLVVWYQDTDLLERLRRDGVPPVYVPEATIRHGLSETVASADPALGAWVRQQVERDRVRFEAKHGAGVAGAA